MNVPLALEANESAFIIFRQHGAERLPTATGLVSDMPVRLGLSGPWMVRFMPGRCAPVEAEFPELISWSKHTDPGIRDFSGTAFYNRQFDMPPVSPGERFILDLGKVAVLASVKVNGRELGFVWKEPYAIDVTNALRSGRNDLEIRIVNTRVNRLVADASLPEEQRITWATWNPFKKGNSLVPSGLPGPVVLRVAAKP